MALKVSSGLQQTNEGGLQSCLCSQTDQDPDCYRLPNLV